MKKIVIRIFFALIGIGLLCGVVWLGFKSKTEPNFVLWFGIASAILAPIGIAAISYSLKSDNNEMLAKLEKVPEIQKLIAEAETQEERIRLLEREREQLVAAVELETRKQSLISRREHLGIEATNMLAELDAVEAELSGIDSEIADSSAKDIVYALNERLEARKRGDIVFRLGGRYVTLNRDFILSLPAGRILLAYFQFFESHIRKRNTANNAFKNDS